MGDQIIFSPFNFAVSSEILQTINSEGRLETRVLRERRRKIASELAHTFLYQIMVNMTFVPKIIFDICKRFFQLGHFTCDHGAEAVASSQSTTDSTTLEYILLQILLLRTRINTLDTTHKKKGGGTRLTRLTRHDYKKRGNYNCTRNDQNVCAKISSPVNPWF